MLLISKLDSWDYVISLSFQIPENSSPDFILEKKLVTLASEPSSKGSVCNGDLDLVLENVVSVLQFPPFQGY